MAPVDEDALEDRWVVDFFAPWCSHCHVMSPKFREAAKALRGVVKFGKLNCELDSSYCLALGIRAYPTIWRFEPNQPRDRPTAEYPGLPDPKMILDFAMAEVPDDIVELSYKDFNGVVSPTHPLTILSMEKSESNAAGGVVVESVAREQREPSY